MRTQTKHKNHWLILVKRKKLIKELKDFLGKSIARISFTRNGTVCFLEEPFALETHFPLEILDRLIKVEFIGPDGIVFWQNNINILIDQPGLRIFSNDAIVKENITAGEILT